MSSINFATREISCKVVYYGPGLSGKTTNLQVIHQKMPQDKRTDMVSLATEGDRTLFFDFLPLNLGDIKGFKTRFQLYTVPGQVYYNSTRKLVLRGVDGIVFVADSQRSRQAENLESLQNLRQNLQDYGMNLDDIPFVLQYNKRDMENVFTLDEMNEQLNPDKKIPFFPATAHNGKGVVTTLKTIAMLVIEKFNVKQAFCVRPPLAQAIRAFMKCPLQKMAVLLMAQNKAVLKTSVLPLRNSLHRRSVCRRLPQSRPQTWGTPAVLVQACSRRAPCPRRLHVRVWRLPFLECRRSVALSKSKLRRMMTKSSCARTSRKIRKV